MTNNVLSDYLSEIARIHATHAGTGEISYYSALTGTLKAAGRRKLLVGMAGYAAMYHP
jgi:hypothetical protein